MGVANDNEPTCLCRSRTILCPEESSASHCAKYSAAAVSSHGKRFLSELKSDVLFWLDVSLGYICRHCKSKDVSS